MIAGLDRVLEQSSQPGFNELRALLEELLGARGTDARLIEHEMLRAPAQGVFRLRFDVAGQARSVVVKRLAPETARRSERVAKRWLPAIGLEGSGPPLLGSVAEPGGTCVWHAYDDLGRCELDALRPDRARIKAVIDLIARMHTRFADHVLLGEVRLHGRDLGIHYYETNVRDALRALEACEPAPEQERLRNRILARLYRLHDEVPQRARALRELGGPETLLHGDLWTTNAFAIPAAEGLRARLIDWDRVGVGPASYDLSTFLLRFPRHHRRWILDQYCRETARSGWRLPPVQGLNVLFETAEYARYANRALWAAIALVQDHASWGWDELAEVNAWFDDLEPVLPPVEGMPAAPLLQP